MVVGSFFFIFTVVYSMDFIDLHIVSVMNNAKFINHKTFLPIDMIGLMKMCRIGTADCYFVSGRPGDWYTRIYYHNFIEIEA